MNKIDHLEPAGVSVSVSGVPLSLSVAQSGQIRSGGGDVLY